MVQGGRLKLIDVFFVQVRPSPWRQAVDLGNMMLVLALRSDARTVYDAALGYFQPEDLAEAFAATRGVASPTQLRQSLKRDDRDLLAEFRSFLPARRPIRIQRWSVRRVLLILATIVGVVFAVNVGISLFFPTRGTVFPASCGTGRVMQLMAQAVPTAERLPCVDQLPFGWAVSDMRIVHDRAELGLGLGEAGTVVTVTLSPACPATTDLSVQTTDVGGGCVTCTSMALAGTTSLPGFGAGAGLSYVSRADLVETVATDEDLTLCGASAPPCDD